MPPLNVETELAGGVCRLSVDGELDIAAAPVLAALAAPALQCPMERLVVDLSGLVFIDSCGARALAAVTGAAPPGCPVVVLGASRRVRMVLDITGVPLERQVTGARDRAAWLVLESQVLVSWAEHACGYSKDVVARCRKTRAARRGTHGQAGTPQAQPAAG